MKKLILVSIICLILLSFTKSTKAKENKLKEIAKEIENEISSKFNLTYANEKIANDLKNMSDEMVADAIKLYHQKYPSIVNKILKERVDEFENFTVKIENELKEFIKKADFINKIKNIKDSFLDSLKKFKIESHNHIVEKKTE